jgi:transposase-like protein
LQNINPRDIVAGGLKFYSPATCPVCSSSDVTFNHQGVTNPFGRLWGCRRCGQGFVLLPAAPASDDLVGLEVHKHV